MNGAARPIAVPAIKARRAIGMVRFLSFIATDRPSRVGACQSGGARPSHAVYNERFPRLTRFASMMNPK
jgi:hypothetical protein